MGCKKSGGVHRPEKGSGGSKEPPLPPGVDVPGICADGVGASFKAKRRPDASGNNQGAGRSGKPSSRFRSSRKRIRADRVTGPRVEAALAAPVTTLKYKPYKSGGGGYIVERNSGTSNTRVQGRVNW